MTSSLASCTSCKSASPSRKQFCGIINNINSTKYKDAKVDPISKKLNEALNRIKGLDGRMESRFTMMVEERKQELRDFGGEMKDMRVESREDMAELRKGIISMKEVIARVDGKMDLVQSSLFE